MALVPRLRRGQGMSYVVTVVAVKRVPDMEQVLELLKTVHDSMISITIRHEIDAPSA